MPRLTDTTIQNAKIGEHSDAQTPGLIFVVRASTSKAAPKARRRFWIYRFTLDGKRLKMGLGAYPAVALEDARKKAKNAASKVANGADPRRTRRRRSRKHELSRRRGSLPNHALPRLAGAKSRHSLQHALRVHARSFHNRTVADIGTRDVASLLKSIPGPYLAERVRSALRGLFASVAIDMEDRGLSMRNPVSTDGLKAASYVPSSSNAHHPALDPAEAPAFMNALRAIPTMDARLLEFTILTVARAGAARAARFDQIDIGAAVWRVPPEQLKDRAHRTEAFLVPLSPRALAIVEEMRAIRPDSTLIFAGAGDTTLIKLCVACAANSHGAIR